MQIGKTPESKTSQVLQSDTDSARTTRRAAAASSTGFATKDQAVISSPARERFLEVGRLVATAKQLDVGKSSAELETIQAKLEDGAFDTEEAVQKAAAEFLRDV